MMERNPVHLLSLKQKNLIRRRWNDDLRNVPSHFKSYSIQDMDIFWKKAKRIMDTYNYGVFEEPTKVKEVNLVELGEVPKSIFVFVDLTFEE